MSKLSRLVSTVLFLALVLSACNLPASGTQEENGGGNASAILTAAAQTVEASLTQTAAQNTPTVAVLPTSTIAPPTVTLAAASPTLNVPAATATQDCDNADFVTDVTIPDGTVVDPSESFTKTWRLKNSGTCSWTSSYAVVFSSGDSMSGPASQALTGNVNPGQTMDISVDLKAPATSGDYTGYWKLRNAAGTTFATFYVTIKVGGGGPFAVTSVDMSVSGGCGNFQIQADIKTNGAGTVTYKWIRSDGATDTATHPDLVFDSAGTKSVTTSWSTTASGDKWMDIYIDKPNHQQFGRANFSCP
jgi:Ig-like domain from next to BRCA1 gene